MSDQIYVPLADCAAACGLSTYVLLGRYWPESFAVPRDWRMLPRSSTVLIAERSLPQLVAHLRAAGLDDEAARLEAWRVELVEPAPMGIIHGSAAGKSSAVEEPWWKRGQFA